MKLEKLQNEFTDILYYLWNKTKSKKKLLTPFIANIVKNKHIEN